MIQELNHIRPRGGATAAGIWVWLLLILIKLTTIPIMSELKKDIGKQFRAVNLILPGLASAFAASIAPHLEDGMVSQMIIPTVSDIKMELIIMIPTGGEDANT